MAKYLDYDGLSKLWAKINENFVKKTGNKAESVTGDKKFTGTITLAGTTLSSGTLSIFGVNTDVTNLSGRKTVFKNGATFVGTALAAGLCTRGICGTDGNGTGKSELYLNYDGSNSYTRKVVLGAGTPGDSLGTGCGNLYAAIRGDEMKAYVAAQGFTKNTGTVTGITMNGKSYDPSNGNVNLGTVLTSHQDISGKQDKMIAGSNILIDGNKISAVIPQAASNVRGGIKTGYAGSGAKIPVKMDGENAYVEATRTALNNAGLNEAYLAWGGKNFAASYGPIDAAMIPDLGADRFAFIPESCWTAEYSRDGGETWTDYGASASQFRALTSTGTNFYIGKADSSNFATEKFMLRLTLTTTGKVYSQLNKFALYVSTNGANGCYCTIQGRTKANLDAGNDTWATFANKVSIAGWSGWNIINTSNITTHGNTASQYANLRFIFGCTSGSTKYVGLQVYKIKAFGGVGWSTPSNMAKYGTVYSYDYNQNVTFPADVYAVNFYAKNSAGAYKSVVLSDDSRLTNSRPASDVYAWAKAATKPSYTASEVGVTESVFPGLKKTGTVTSVAVKMNGGTKGTVTDSGTIDLGNVITAHQDISGKQDKTVSITDIKANTVEGALGEINSSVHELSGDVDDLFTAVAKKADKTHTHAIADVTDLQSTLDGKAAKSHMHPIGEVTNLQSELDGKQAKLSTAQLNAVNSGITSSKVATYDTLNSQAWRNSQANKGGAIDVHPENGGTIIGYYTNDLAFLAQRGGTARMTNTTTGTVVWDITTSTWTSAQNNIFDGSPSYYNFAKLGSTSEVIVILIKSPVQYSWGTQIGIGFGSATWRAKNIKIEMGYSPTNKGTAQEPDSDIAWVTRADVTNYSQGLYYTSGNGPSAEQGGASNNSGTWSYMRVTLTNFNTANAPRIAQIFSINYGSKGMHNTFLPRNGGDVYGSLALRQNLTVAGSMKKGNKDVLTTDDKATLQNAINGKANSSHTHAISEVTNLQTTLDGKAAKSHTHSYKKAKLTYDSSDYSMSLTYDDTATN